MRSYFENLYMGSKEELVQQMEEVVMDKKKMFCITANPEIFMHAKKNNRVESIVVNPNYRVVADGIGIIYGAKKLKLKKPEKINGVDLAHHLLELANEKKKSIYLFGAKEEVLETLITKIKNQYPNIYICGYHHGYTDQFDLIKEDILKKKPDIVLVALGVPKQELFIEECYQVADRGIFIGVGGSFDVLSGCKKRAPRLFQTLNLEWLYRILREPSRFKRFYQNNIKFLFQLKS